MLNLVTDLGDVDLTFTPSGGLGGFDEWSAHAIAVEIAEGLTVRVASLDGIIHSKRAANRLKDQMRCRTWSRCATNFASVELRGSETIGGVPPFGHKTHLRVFIDPALLQYDEVWAAAGTWTEVFGIEPHKLVEASEGVVVELRRG